MVLAEALRDTKYPIVALNFANNELSHKDMHNLCSALVQGAGLGLVHLCLSNVEALQKNRFGWQGGKILADFLRMQLRRPDLIKLQILNLSGTTLGTKGAEYLLHAMADTAAVSSLAELDISKNEIIFGQEHMKHLCEVFDEKKSGLVILNISSNQLSDDMLGMLLPSLCKSYVTHLNLDSTKLTLRGLASFFQQLRSNYTLQSASLSGNDFSLPEDIDDDQSLTLMRQIDYFLSECLSTNQALVTLRLERCQLYDRAARAIGKGMATNKSLQCLLLAGNCLSDECVEALFKGLVQSTLKRVDFSSNKLKNAGAKAIAEVIKSPECKIQEIDLTNNFIESKGATELHYGMITNRHLRSLKLAMNVGISYSLLLKIKKSLNRNR